MERSIFDKTRFGAGMQVEYKNSTYDIISVDFEEGLIGIDETGDSDSLSWKRCENVTLMDK